MKKLVLGLIILFASHSFILSQVIWEALDSPSGANVNTLFKVNDSIYLCGVQFDGSLYRTTNAGQNWEKVYQGHHPSSSGNKAVRCFAFNSNNDLIVSMYTDGIKRSTDNGETWIQVSGGGGEGIINTRSGTMFGYDNVVSNWAFTRSLDSGKTWVYLPPPYTSSVYSLANQGDSVFICLRDSIIFSVDFAASWTKLGNSFSGGGIYSLIFLSENEVIAGTGNGFYYSSNSGTNWVLRNNGIPGTSKVIRELEIYSDTIFATGKMGMIFTTDKGENWQHYNNGSFQKDVNSATYSENLKLICNYAGIYKVEPDEWIHSSNGIYALSPYSLFRCSNGNLLFNSSAGLFRSDDDGGNWDCVESDMFFGGCIGITEKNNLIFANKSDSFYLSTDFGESWIFTSFNPYYGVIDISFSMLGNSIYSSLSYFDPILPPTYGLYVSNNFGVSWSVLEWNYTSMLNILNGDTLITNQQYWQTGENLGLVKSDNKGLSWYDFNIALPNKDVKSFTLDKNGNYYTSINKGVYKCNKISNYWVRFSDSTLSSVNSIAFDNYNNCIVVNNGKILASVNGKHWDDCSQGISTNTILKIIADPQGIYYALDKNGRIYSSNSLVAQKPNKPELNFPVSGIRLTSDTVSFNWFSSSSLVISYNFQLAKDSLFTSPIDTTISDTSLTLYNLESNKKFYWRVKANNQLGWSEYSNVETFSINLTSIDNDFDLIQNYSLSPNYPNPFNPTTTISYHLPKTGNVTIKVYDVLGREIATLVNEEKPSGSFKVEFTSHSDEGQNLPSGVYFYQLKVEDFIQTKKMILLK